MAAKSLQLKNRLAALLGRVEAWRLWVFWPLAALVFHVLLFPYIYETKKISDVPDVEQLIEDRGGYLGMYRSREIHVTYGRIGKPIYVERLVSDTLGEVGVVVAYFLSIPGFATQPGPVVTAIQSRIRQTNRGLAERFDGFLEKAAHLNPGKTAAFDIDTDGTSRIDSYPIDKVVLVMLEKAQTAESYTANITSGLRAALAKDHLAGTGSMIVTFLGLGPGYQPVSTDRFLGVLFDAIPTDAGGGRLFIGLFEGWPNNFLETVIRDLNRVWDGRTVVGISGMIFALQLRFALVCLALCLLVCSFATALSMKNAFVISGAYLGSVFASEKMVTFFFSTFDPDVVVLVSLVVQVVLAMFFPVVAKLNPKGVFDKAGAG